DLPQLGLYPEVPGVRPVDGGAGRGEVLGVRQAGRVVHHGAEARLGRLAQQVVALDVVEVQRDGPAGAFGGPGRRAGQGEQAPVAEPDGVLAGLEHDGGAGRFGAGDDGLDVFEGDDVEGGDGTAGRGGAGDQVAGGREGHGFSCRVVVRKGGSPSG